MAAPTSQVNITGQSLDTMYGLDGTGRIKLGVGNFAPAGLTPAAAGHAVGTHVSGDTLGASDLVVLAGVYNPTTGDVEPLTLNAGEPTTFKSLAAVVITSETTIWTPAAGKKFRLMGFVITQGVVTGDITLKDDTAGTTILVIPATPEGQPLAVSLGRVGLLSSTADHVLTATGVSTETISGFVYGTEE